MSDPDVLIYPRDQRDAPPPAGLEVSPSSSSSLITPFQQARLLDPNLPSVTSTPAMLRLPRDQRDAPPPGLQANLRRELYGQGITPGTRVGIQSEISAPARSPEAVQRDPLGLETFPSNAQPISPLPGTARDVNSADPNRPDATSNPAVLETPRDQRDAPPTNSSPSTIR